MKTEEIEDKVELYFNSNIHKNDINKEYIVNLKYKINNLVTEHLKNINLPLIEVFLTDDYSPNIKSISLDDKILKITSFVSKDLLASRYGANAVKVFKDDTYFLELSRKTEASLICVHLPFDDKEIIFKLENISNDNNKNNALLINQYEKAVGFLLCYQN